MLQPGLNFVIPFVDRVAYRHDLREIPLDVPSQICITTDNTQLQVDGILYFQVTDPKLASYGSSNFVLAITQLAQTTLRSVIGRMELDRTFEERDHINAPRRRRARPGRGELGRQGAALRDQGPDAAEGDPARDAGADHRRAREARGDRDLGGQAAGADQPRQRRARRRRSPSRRARSRPRSTTRRASAAAILAIAEANAEAIRQVAEAIEARGGINAVNLKVAEQYVAAFAGLARTDNTLIVPSNLADLAGLVATATTVFKTQVQIVCGVHPPHARRGRYAHSSRASAIADATIATKNTNVHDGIARPRNSQPCSAHSPLPFSTRPITSDSGNVSSM